LGRDRRMPEIVRIAWGVFLSSIRVFSPKTRWSGYFSVCGLRSLKDYFLVYRIRHKLFLKIQLTGRNSSWQGACLGVRYERHTLIWGESADVRQLLMLFGIKPGRHNLRCKGPNCQVTLAARCDRGRIYAPNPGRQG